MNTIYSLQRLYFSIWRTQTVIIMEYSEMIISPIWTLFIFTTLFSLAFFFKSSCHIMDFYWLLSRIGAR